MVIASSEGDQNSIEESHGYFTGAVLRDLDGKAADPNGSIKVSRLDAFVARDVQERSKGQQVPYVRNDNLKTSRSQGDERLTCLSSP